MSEYNPAEGRWTPFPRQVINTTQVLLSIGQGRWAFVVYNEGDNTVLLGNSGTAITNWMALEAGQSFTDTYTNNNWWAVGLASSGTVSGFSVY